jgi:glycerophosphoryl diester phosphodiesterase
VYNGGSFKVPLGYDYARFTIALVTDAGVSVSSFIDANVSLTYSSDKTFLDSTTVTKIIGARIVNDNHNFNTYMVLSHRGFNNVAPENTLEAYALSVEKGYKYFETDISWTSDGVPVLLHDNTIDRTSNGTGNISSMTFATARTYDFGSWKSPEYTGVKIPSFEEFVHMCLCENAIPCFETKSNLSDTQLSTLLSILSKYGMLDKCMWLSSYSSNLVKIVNLKPNATVVYVPYTAITQAMISIVSTFQNGVNKAYVTVQKVHLNQNTLADIILAKNSNIGIIAWDVFSNEECFELAKLGVVGFTVDAVLPKDILKQSTYYLS